HAALIVLQAGDSERGAEQIGAGARGARAAELAAGLRLGGGEQGARVRLGLLHTVSRRVALAVACLGHAGRGARAGGLLSRAAREGEQERRAEGEADQKRRTLERPR